MPSPHPSQATHAAQLDDRMTRFVCSRRELLFGAASGALIATGLAAPSRSHAQDTPDSIKIGALYNLTGSLSTLDQPAMNGSLLAAKEINAAGGVLGRPVELVPFDGASDITTVSRGAMRLINDDEVSILIGLTDTSYVLAAGQVAQDAGVPFIDVGGTAPVITSIGNNIFMLPFGDNVQASAGAEYAASQGWRSCAILYDRENAYPSVLSGYFKDRWQMDDIRGMISVETSYHPEDPDVIAQLARIQATDPTMSFLYVAAMPDRIGKIVEQARDMGLQQPILSGDGCDTPLLVEEAGAHSNGVVFTNHVGLLGGSKAGNQFAAAYEEEYGHRPETAFASLGYDGLKLAVDAISRAGLTSAGDIRATLETTQGFEGITGEVSYSPGNRVPKKSVAIVKVVDEQQTLVETLLPASVVTP